MLIGYHNLNRRSKKGGKLSGENLANRAPKSFDLVEIQTSKKSTRAILFLHHNPKP